VIEDVAEPFQSVLTRAVEEVTYGRGSLLFTASSTGSAVRERSVVLAFCARRVDGLIVIPEPHSHGYLHPELDAGIRAVFIDRPPQDIDTDVVLADNAGGARAGVDHLLRHGHRRIGYLGDRPELFTATERLRGFREGLEAAGVPFDDALVCMAAPDRDWIAETLARMLAGPDPATAVMTGNSLLSLGVLRALGDAPRRPALLGFDDFELADIISPGLTVVAQDPASMGRTAADLLFRRLAGEDGPPQTIQLRTTLIPRGSAEAAPASP
jgi:LacI family transcriptional regulator